MPDSVVRHKLSQSYGSVPERKTYHVSRNVELIFWEFIPRRLLWRAVWDHLLLTILHAASKTWQGRGVAYLSGKLAFLARSSETSPGAGADRGPPRSPNGSSVAGFAAPCGTLHPDRERSPVSSIRANFLIVARNIRLLARPRSGCTASVRHPAASPRGR